MFWGIHYWVCFKCVWYHSRFTVFGPKMESTLPMSTSQPSIFGLQMPSFLSNLLRNSPIFPDFFPFKNVTLPSNSCTSTFLHWNYQFSKKKNTPLKKEWEKHTLTTHPPATSNPKCSAREWLSRSVLGMPCFPYTRWPVDCYPHGEPRSLEVFSGFGDLLQLPGKKSDT